jgi:hypothetical protein
MLGNNLQMIWFSDSLRRLRKSGIHVYRMQIDDFGLGDAQDILGIKAN